MDDPDACITLYLGSDGAIMDVCSNQLEGRDSDLDVFTFRGLWFGFPTPFKKGDIVVDPSRPESDGFCSGPFVVTSINLDPIEDKKQYDYAVKNSDNTDMNGHGYFQADDGMLYAECQHNYMNLEYYRGEMTGRMRIMKAMSNFLKGEIGEELFANAYHLLLLEEYRKNMMPNWYTEEGMELTGLREEKDGQRKDS